MSYISHSKVNCMNSRLQFLLRKNIGKRLINEYLKSLSRLINHRYFIILNLEDSEPILERIVANNELMLEKKVAGVRIYYFHKRKYFNVLSTIFSR